MTTSEQLKARVVAAIDENADRIVGLSDEIMRNPETGFREHATARRVADQFRQMGLTYRSGLAGTGVKARLRGRSRGPTVAVIGELDSLLDAGHALSHPETGAAHTCGHNAQIASMLGAGLGLQAVMDALDGDVVLFAVPAEECIELEWRLQQRAAGLLEFVLGKPELIRLGEFDDVDVALITHTTAGAEGPLVTATGTANGSLIKQVRFRGKAAHAGMAPWEGVNAFKALALAVAGIDAQRETFKDEDYVRVSHLVTRGGDAVSAIPADVQMEMMIRARTAEAMADASEKVDRALCAGALAVAAEVAVTTLTGYLPLNPDEPLVDVLDANCRALLGQERVVRDAGHLPGSTDVGDLGRIMPVVHPLAASGADVPLHTSDYYVRDHVLAAVNPAKFMAMTVVDLLCDGARGGRRVIAQSGSKLSRDEYVTLRRSLDREVEFSGADLQLRSGHRAQVG